MLVKYTWYDVLDKHDGVQGCWLSPYGMVCWISTAEHRGAR